LAFLYSTRRDLLGLAPGVTSKRSNQAVWIVGLVVALALAILSPLASEHPDGLEWVAEEKGFLDAAQDAPYQIIPDYLFPGLTNVELATIVAGIVGTAIVFGVALGIAYLRRRRPTAAYEV
jgi:predicted outer membrane lipoprotein